MKSQIKYITICAAALGSLSLSSCGGSEAGGAEGETTTTTKKPPVVKNDGQGTITLNVGGQVFAVNSPIQMADLIAKSNATFQGEKINPTSNAEGYTSIFQKALNMGIYGADFCTRGRRYHQRAGHEEGVDTGATYS